MTRVVISQPLYCPWVGMFEQIRLADTYAKKLTPCVADVLTTHASR